MHMLFSLVLVEKEAHYIQDGQFHKDHQGWEMGLC